MNNDTFHGTTILALRTGGTVVMAGDGQVTLGSIVTKHKAKKVRRIFHDQIITGFAGDSDTPRLGCVFVLPMATTRGNQIPPILLDPFDRFPNRHPQTISKNMTIINYCITSSFTGQN